MKTSLIKRICIGLALLLTLCCSSALADGLIVYKDTGETVVRVQIRLRELGYFNYKPTGVFQSMSVNATVAFQQSQTDAEGNPIISDGTIGDQTMQLLFSPNAVRARIPADVHIPIGRTSSSGEVESGTLLSWSEVKKLLKIGSSYQITDFNTGSTFKMKYTGGENHAEMECPTVEDTSTFKDVFGDEFNYSKRPVIIALDGQTIAASLQGEPHGVDTVAANNMAGHCCLYFEGSTSHVGSLPDMEHINTVFKAAGVG